MSKSSELRLVSNDDHSPQRHLDTQELRTLSGDAATPTELLVLSRDRALLEVVQKAAPSVVHVIQANDLDEVADKPGLNPGVLVVDTSVTSDVHAMLPQLLQHFPEIAIIVVGKRDDISALMRLTASGRVFRFLVLPLSHGQARLALTSAIAHHLEVKAANLRTGAVEIIPVKKFSAAYLALGAGLLVAVAAIWFGIGAFTSSEPTPLARQSAPAAPTSLPIASQPTAMETQLQLAKDAFEQGNYVEPKGANALDLFRKALEMEPENTEAQAGIRAVADKILGRAERSLTEQRLSEAVQGIEIARSIDAANPRLEFLDTQVNRERERLKLDEDRDRTQRVRRLIQQASVHMAQQRYLRPAGANARDVLVEARKLDPADPAVSLAIDQLATALVDAARKSASAGETAQTKELLEAARKMGASAATLAAAERSFQESSKNGEASLARAAGPALTPLQQERSTASTANEEGRGPSNQRTDGASAPSQTSAHPAEVRTSSSSTAASAQPANSRPDQWLQAIDLPRKREVAPDYPTQPFINGIEGWVDVDFTISPEGVPENLRVRDSSPRRTFDRAALDSVRQWRFVPIVENGNPVARRATLRVRFQRQ